MTCGQLHPHSILHHLSRRLTLPTQTPSQGPTGTSFKILLPHGPVLGLHHWGSPHLPTIPVDLFSSHPPPPLTPIHCPITTCLTSISDLIWPNGTHCLPLHSSLKLLVPNCQGILGSSITPFTQSLHICCWFHLQSRRFYPYVTSTIMSITLAPPSPSLTCVIVIFSYLVSLVPLHPPGSI